MKDKSLSLTYQEFEDNIKRVLSSLTKQVPTTTYIYFVKVAMIHGKDDNKAESLFRAHESGRNVTISCMYVTAKNTL